MATRQKNRSKSRSAKTLVTVTIAVVILFVLIGLSCYMLGLRTPQKNLIGPLGHWVGLALFYAFGWTSILLPVLAAAAGFLSVLKHRPWRRLTALVVFSFSVMLTLGLVSYHGRMSEPDTNLAGWLGLRLAAVFSYLLGLGSYCLPAIAVIIGLGLWSRWSWKQYLLRSLLAASSGLVLDAFLAYFAPRSFWYVPTGQDFSFAGTVGLALNSALHNIVGPVGTLILLIAVVVVFLGLFTTIQMPAGTRLLDRLRMLFTTQARRRAVPDPVPHMPEPGPQAPKQQALVPEQRTEADDAEDPGLSLRPRVTPPKPRLRASKTLTDFDLSRFQASFLEQLDQPGPEDQVFKNPTESAREAEQLLDKLRQFGVDGQVTNIVSGPMITRFEFEPAPGIKIQRIESLSDDLSLALAAERIRILAPIPGRNAVGIEIPNKQRRTVHLRDVLTSDAFRQEKPPLGFALGTTITGEPYCADLRLMPHILIAGTTGSGKSVCINSIITSLIYRCSPRDVRFLAIDPKQLELPVYNPIPHLLGKATIDPKKAVGELDEVIKIMEVRYGQFAELGVRDIVGYNARAEAEGKERKPYIVIIIDELADLMLRAPTEIEERITRLAQMSRAVGIHLILATQRPSVDVITGLIKANFPCRIAFQVASKTDSRTILDMNGAESLLGRGDMLFLPPGKGDPIRLHGAFVSDRAARQVVNLWTVAYLTDLLKSQVPDPEAKAKEMVEAEVVDILYDPEKRGIRKKRQDLCSILSEEVMDDLLSRDYYEPLPEVRSGAVEGYTGEKRRESREIDEYFDKAARLVVRYREASVSMLQRKLDVGWARAGRIIDQLEEAGVVGPYAGSKSREVTVESEAELEKLLVELKTGPAAHAEPTEAEPEPGSEDDSA